MSSLFRSLINPATIWTGVLLMGTIALAALAHSSGSGPAAAVERRGGMAMLCQAACPLRSAPPRVGPAANAQPASTPRPTND